MDSRQPDLLKPTLISGAVFGTAAAIPFLNLVNVCCCALVWGCGLFAAYLYSNASRTAGVAFRPGNGAMVGLVAGAFYAVVTTVVSSVMTLLFGERLAALFAGVVENMPEAPSWLMDAMDQVVAEAGKVSVVSFLLGLLLNVLVGAVFATLGGLLGGAVFKVEPPPPPPMTPPPAPEGSFP